VKTGGGGKLNTVEAQGCELARHPSLWCTSSNNGAARHASLVPHHIVAAACIDCSSIARRRDCASPGRLGGRVCLTWSWQSHDKHRPLRQTEDITQSSSHAESKNAHRVHHESELQEKSYRVPPGKGNEYQTGGNKSCGVPSSPGKPQSRVGS
jgi:hypothetical protein